VFKVLREVSRAEKSPEKVREKFLNFVVVTLLALEAKSYGEVKRRPSVPGAARRHSPAIFNVSPQIN
jgi:hypothetical protein